jgi:hypothetical protein
MPVRSSIKTTLPDHVRAELDRRLVASEFSNYDDLIEWLREQGFSISHSALGRYSMRFERKLAAMKAASDQARAVIQADPDQGGAMNDALVRLLSGKSFNVLVEAEEVGETGDLAKLARAVSQLGRVTLRQREWSEAVRERLDAQKAAAQKKIDGIEKKGGLTKEAADAIRDVMLGIDQWTKQPLDNEY